MQQGPNQVLARKMGHQRQTVGPSQSREHVGWEKDREKLGVEGCKSRRETGLEQVGKALCEETLLVVAAVDLGRAELAVAAAVD